jgi:replicative DNA helicase
LFIVTEQTFPQIRKMILAYLSDINDSRFKLGHFTKEEEERLDKAISIMEQFSDNLVLVKMPNPTIELVKTIVRENCLTKDIGYVFYDYIFVGPALLGEFRGFTLRNDEVLLMFATALKDLAVELNVAMFTSTQVNASADDNKNIRNEASLAGGRSTINKADNGAIMARPSNEELETLQPITAKYGVPNVVTDIFKARSGEWTQVRIWSIVNLGTMKKRDLFITDSRLEVIDGFFEDDLYEVHAWDDEEYQSILAYTDYLNGKE